MSAADEHEEAGDELQPVFDGIAERLRGLQPGADELARIEQELCAARLAAAEGDGPRQAALALELQQRAGRLERALGEAEPATATPAGLRSAWAQLLLDRADDLLASVEQWEPGEAATRLREVEREIGLHLRTVERERGHRRRRLRRRARRLKAEREERELAARLEKRFGVRVVTALERLVLALIFLVLGLLTVELVFDPPPRVLLVMTLVDAGACLVFLFEFALKWSFTRFSLSWFRRHVWIDLLPSLPLGLLTLQTTGPDPLRIGRALRLFRLARVARYVRVAWPVLRLVRGLGFLVRGLDRLVHAYGPLLNREILLHPIRGGGALGEASKENRAFALELAQLVDLRWESLEADGERERKELRRLRLDALSAARAEVIARPLPRLDAAAAGGRAVWLAELARALQAMTAEEVEGALEVVERARLARGARLLARAPLRWIPFVKRFAPRTAEGASDEEVIAQAARRFGREIEHHHRRLLWFADLYGTITPSELVDIVGTALVRHSFRPAWRLMLFGGIYGLVLALLSVARAPWLSDLSVFLERTVGTTLILLGSICLVVLAAGWWMRRLASQATAFYRNTARASFLRLTKSIKSRSIEADAEWLERRVLAPEAALAGRPAEGPARAERLAERVRAWLLAAQGCGDTAAGSDAFERTVLIYRDSLDGVLFGVDDTHTSGHLLGNPALRSLRAASRRADKRERRLLRKLEADQVRAGLFGPALWRRLISESLAQGAARLVVEYGRQAVPVDELEAEDEEERADFEAWLARNAPVVQEGEKEHAEALDNPHLTTHFSALHFLDDDPSRDAEVERRFGARVLSRLREDRRALIRRVYGSFPLQELPRGQRVLNPLVFYDRWFSSGRVLLAPLRLTLHGLMFVRSFLRQLLAAVREIRDPTTGARLVAPTGVEWIAARRKLDRTRGQAARICMWFRALADAEYLGLALPGVSAGASGVDETEDVEADMLRLDADAGWRTRVEEERERARADLARVERLLDDTRDVSPEAARALALAYRLNLGGLRDALSATDVVLEAIDCALEEAPRRCVLLPKLELRRAFRRFWSEHAGDIAAASDAPDARRRAWRAVARNRRGATNALLAWSREDVSTRERRGRESLARALRRPSTATDSLVTLRAVQTASLVELRQYRRHVARLGDFEDAREDPLVG